LCLPERLRLRSARVIWRRSAVRRAERRLLIRVAVDSGSVRGNGRACMNLAWFTGSSFARGVAVVWLLALLTAGEARLFERLLFVDAAEYGFVLQNVEGVLGGRPVSKSWQQRFLAPRLVTALDMLTHDRLASLRLFGAVLAFIQNLTLFAIARFHRRSYLAASTLVLCFVLVHFLYLYKLEYPWDAIDSWFMLIFGVAAGHGVALFRLWPLLVLGVFNHETILYIPLYDLLVAAQQRSLRRAAIACVWLLACIAAIYVLREHYYLGQPNWPGQAFERATPLMENHWHVEHNLRQWFWADFQEGRKFISLSLSTAVLSLCVCLRSRKLRSIALWSLCVLASIVCFGYVNETRHYLLLIAFWFGFLVAAPDCKETRPSHASCT
jgi:hypothetical protein